MKARRPPDPVEQTSMLPACSPKRAVRCAQGKATTSLLCSWEPLLPTGHCPRLGRVSHGEQLQLPARSPVNLTSPKCQSPHRSPAKATCPTESLQGPAQPVCRHCHASQRAPVLQHHLSRDLQNPWSEKKNIPRTTLRERGHSSQKRSKFLKGTTSATVTQGGTTSELPELGSGGSRS